MHSLNNLSTIPVAQHSGLSVQFCSLAPAYSYYSSTVKIDEAVGTVRKDLSVADVSFVGLLNIVSVNILVS